MTQPVNLNIRNVLHLTSALGLMLCLTGKAEAAPLTVNPGVSFTLGGNFNFNGGTVANTGTLNIIINATVTFNNGSILNNNGEFNVGQFNSSGKVINNGIFNNNNGATLNINLNSAFDNYDTFNNYGTLNGQGVYTNLGTLNNYGDSPNVIIRNEGTINFAAVNGAGISIGTLNSTGTAGTISGAGKTLTVNVGNYSGSLGAMQSFTKATTGTLNLNGNNATFSAPVNVSAGTLYVGNTAAASAAVLGNGTSDLSVSNGATIGGYGRLNFQNVLLSPGSTYFVGASSPTQSGKLNATNNLTITGSNLLVNVDPTVLNSGNVNLTIAEYGNNLTGTFASIQPMNLTEVTSINYGSGNNSAITITTRQANTLVAVSDPTGDVATAVASAIETISTRNPANAGRADEFRFNPRSYVIAPFTPRNKSVRGKLRSTNPRSAELFQALAQNGPVVIEQQESRFWVAPYYVQGSNRIAGSRSNSKDYNEGAAFGIERLSKEKCFVMGLSGSFGIGQQKTPSNFRKNKTSNIISSIGAYHAQKFGSGGRYDLSGSVFYSRFDTTRYGNPLPGIFYAAKGKFNSISFVGNLLTSWKFKVSERFSIRPSIGLSASRSRISGFSETGAGIYSQSYSARNSHSAEPYAGVGLRRTWSNENYDWKITGIYEYGYELAKNDSKVTICTPSGPVEGNTFNSKGPGRQAHYITVYGTVLNKAKNYKTLLGVTSTILKNRTSHALTLKLEWRW